MKAALLLLVFLMWVPQSVWADESKLFSTDHAAHFGLSFVATELGYAVGSKMGANKFQSWFISALAVNAVGVIKEVSIDKQTDMNDIYSNAAGSVGAGLFVWSFDF